MTRHMISLVLLFTVIIFYSAHVCAHQFNGNWYFVKGEYKKQDGTVLTANNKTLAAIKTIDGNKFALTNAEKGRFVGFLSGEFKLDGDHYSEIIKEGTSQAHLGNTYTFKGWITQQVENGVNIEYWHHKGMVNGVEETEVWRRLN